MALSDITPALTPAEWAEYTDQPFTDGDFALGKPSGYPLGRRHALAALALHGHPAGFTRDMLEWVEQATTVADHLRCSPQTDEERADNAMRQALAARIAALLPPEDA